jgi:histidine triad (HIT) family protein
MADSRDTSYDPDCRFCRIAAGELPAAIVHIDDEVVAFLDRTPLFFGHTLVIPRSHVPDLGSLGDGAVLPLMRVVRAAARAMESSLHAEGSFVAVNNHVSQSVPHLHVHVVPRRRGDGLRGFFWPRVPYASAAAAAVIARRIAAAL